VEASEKGDVTTLLTILGLNPNAPKEAVGDVAFVKALADQALKRAEATLLKHRDFLNDKKKKRRGSSSKRRVTRRRSPGWS